MRSYVRVASLSALLCSLLLSGCAASFSPSPLTVTPASLSGNVHGGRQPIAGAHVYLFSAGTSGYGSASTSLLNSIGSVAFPTTKDTADNNYYITTDANGGFDLTGSYTCVSGSQVYLYAVGGNPGLAPGMTNSASGLLAVLGNCPATGNFVPQISFLFVNEVSTIAAAYAFAGFATDATHVGSSGTPLAATGIANAFANAANLADIGTGIARSAPAYSAGTAPQQKVNALANSLAACINSTGAGSTQCSTLFANAKSTGASGTVATDTATVAINIAHNPGNAIHAIYTNPAGIGAPFQPVPSAEPTDLTLEINLYSGTLGFPTYVAFDAQGNAWVSCYSNGITKYSPTGVLLSGNLSFTGGGINHASHIAIDTLGNAWIANQSGGAVTKLAPNGTPANSTGFKGNSDLDPAGIAIDASGNVWVSNYSKNTISKLDSTGAEVVGSPYTVAGLAGPWSLSLDGTGNVWVGNMDGAEIAKLTNAGASAGAFTTGGYSIPREIAIGLNGGPWVSNYGALTITGATSVGAGTSFSGGGLDFPSDIAVDGLGNVWAANHSNNSVSEFTSAGVAITSSAGYTSPDMNVPYGIAVDGSGNVWVTNGNGDTMSIFIGAAAPAITPKVAAVIANTIGTRP